MPALRFRRLSAIVLALFLSACEVERGSGPAPVLSFGARVDSVAGGVIAKKGDTLSSIARNYRVPVQDIIDINGLEEPYELALGQRVILPLPTTHKVGSRDTLYGISRMYAVSVDRIAQANGLRRPYRLKAGQVVRIPAAQRRQYKWQAKRDVETHAPDTPVTVRTTVERESLPPPQGKKDAVKPLQKLASSTSPRRGFIWPVRGKVISSYGPKAGQLYNDGINIAAPRGTPVMAANDGVVAYAGDDLSGYGNLVLIRHAGGLVTAYAHLNNITVKKGDSIARGQAIGTVGSTGTVANTQLHFEVRRGLDTLNPQDYL